MPRIRFFADPESTVIKTFQVADPDGQVDSDTGAVLVEEHHLELRTELSDREWSDLELGIAPRATATGELILDLSGASFRQLAVWIKSWSLTGNLGGKTRPTEEHLGKLRPDLAKVIRGLVETHVQEMHQRRREATNPTAPSDELEAAAPAMVASPPRSFAAGASAMPATTSWTGTPDEPGSS